MDRSKVSSVDHYIDAGRSAKDQNCPELQRLEQDVVDGKIDAVVVVKLDPRYLVPRKGFSVSETLSVYP